MSGASFPLHPGGGEATGHLLRLAMPHCAGCASRRALNMGAGDGAAVHLLKAFGWEAEGIDKKGGAGILSGDLLRTPYPEGSFGLVLSECSFFVTGDFGGALREAWRVLEPGGILAIGDVCFCDAAEWKGTLKSLSFHLLEWEDLTELWREYYLEAVWNGTSDAFCPVPKKKCRYFLAVAAKK